MTVDGLKKSIRAIDLALATGKKKQSPRTGFVHHFPADESVVDTIPLYENFLFALALFRHKTAEAVLEGKELLERLLAFQSEEGNFPIYLHDHPRCWDPHLALKIAPVFVHLLRDFGSILGEGLQGKLASALKRAIGPERPLSPVWDARRKACQGISVPCPAPSTLPEWYEWIVTSQLVCSKEKAYPIPFDVRGQVFLGEQEAQERGEPEPHAVELLLAERLGIRGRLLNPHPSQLYAALLYPFTSSLEVSKPFALLPRQSGGFRLLWEGATLHSLFVPSGQWDGERVVFELSGDVQLGREDLYEAQVFCDLSLETQLFIEKQRGMVFRLDETVTVATPQLRIEIRFEKLSGEGEFCGHIARGNRPGQTACRGARQYEAYDWRIGLRTLRRSGPCTIAAAFRFYPTVPAPE